MAIKDIDTVIIGAGLTGLSTGLWLKKQGTGFLIIDKKDRAGGVIETRHKDGFTYEAGPNTGVIGQPEVADLFAELKGLCELEVANAKSKKRYVLKKGKWHALPMGLVSAVTTPLFSFGDKLRVLGEPFRKPGTNEHENLADMVRRRLGKSFLNYAVDPFILGIYAGDPEKLIPKYALPKLYNLEQNYGSFIRGSMKKAKERKADPELQKATREVFSVKGGLSNMVDALVKYIGPERIVLGKEYTFRKDENGNYIGESLTGDTIRAKNLVSTVPAYAVSGILPFLPKEQTAILDKLFYAPVVEVPLGFPEWRGMPLDGFGGLVPHKEGRDILGAMFMSTLFEGRAPEGGALMSIFMGGVRNRMLAGQEAKTILPILYKEIKSLFGLKNIDRHIYDVLHHPRAIPQYYADTGERYDAIAKMEQENPGLILGGNMRGGIGMADRIKQGKEMAYEVSAKG